MFHLWQKSKLYRQPASEIINLQAYCEDLTGLRGPDELTAWLFNNAVEYVGRWIESKWNELTDEGKPRYTLEYLLTDRTDRKQRAAQLEQFFGMGEVVQLDTLLNDPAYIAQIEAGLVNPPPNWTSTQQ